MAGKRPGRGQLNAVVPGQLLHLTDELSARQFLVDTGASYSIFPHTASDPATGPLLKGPGGQSIACWGEKQVEVVFLGRRFQWPFLLAQVDFAILGADFLKHFGLVVDLAAGRLLDTVTLQCFPAAVTPASPPLLRGGLFAVVAATPQ